MKRMKFALVFLTVCVSTPGFALKNIPAYKLARLKGADAKFALHVVDDEGVAVAGAKIRVFMGMNIRENGYWLNGSTGADGVWVLQGKTCGNEIEIGVKKEGYYDSNVKMSLATMESEHEVKDGKWQPWGAEKMVPLRRIRNRLHPETHGGAYDIPVTNNWVSFDLMDADWTKPYGKGRVADVEVKYGWNGAEPLKWVKQNLTIRYLGNPLNGGYFCETVAESSFPYSYRASEVDSKYQREIKDDMLSSMPRFGLLDGSHEIIFRIRSVTNEVGELVSCHYGRFRRFDYGLERSGFGSLMLRYDWNPSSKDVNLEFEKELGKKR